MSVWIQLARAQALLRGAAAAALLAGVCGTSADPGPPPPVPVPAAASTPAPEKGLTSNSGNPIVLQPLVRNPSESAAADIPDRRSIGHGP